MMPTRKPLALRQELVEMPTPTRRVLARAAALGLGGIQHILDPAAQALGRLGHALP